MKSCNVLVSKANDNTVKHLDVAKHEAKCCETLLLNVSTLEGMVILVILVVVNPPFLWRVMCVKIQ